MKHILRSARWIILFAVLCLVGMSMAYAAPARAREGGDRRDGELTVTKPQAALGAASLFGIDEGGLLSYDTTALNLAVASGAHWTRTEINWAAIEATQGVYVFPPDDNDPLKRLLNSGLSPVVYVSYNPPWASTLPCAPIDTNDPALVSAFGNFMYELVAHYPEVQIWGLYNEPDQPTGDAGSTSKGCFAKTKPAGGINGNGVPDYQEYAIMLKTAWKAVHTANPNAKLATGAFAFDSFMTNDNGVCVPSGYPSCNGGAFRYDFVTNLFGYIGDPKNALLNGDKYIDMVMFNYYDVYGPYWESRTKAKDHGIQAKANMLRLLMQQANMTPVDLFVTETGIPSVIYADKAGQARCLDINMVRGAAGGLKGIVWWTFKDFADNDPNKERRDWKYGIVDQNMAIKPAYTAMQVLVAELNDYSYDTTLSGKTGFVGVEAYRFKNGGATKFAVWSSSIKSTNPWLECAWVRNKKLVSFKSGTIRVVDYMGGVKTIKDGTKKDKDTRAGYVGIKVAGDPKIVQLNP